MTSNYAQQAALVIKAIPLIAKEDIFALKGGTATRGLRHSSSRRASRHHLEAKESRNAQASESRQIRRTARAP